MRRAVVLLCLVAACGGTIEDTSPPTSETGNAPANAPRGEAPCDLACERIHVTCTSSPRGLDACATSCLEEFAEGSAPIYAACIQSLDCETIERGIAMSYGPLGACWSRARGR